MTRYGRSSKGQVIVLVAIALVVTLALVGLALDVGRAYGVKARLNAAVDAASIAGGRGVKQGADDATRMANAQAAAQNAFSANFNEGYLGATSVAAPNITVTPVHNPDGTWTVTVSAARALPTYLAKLVGWSTLNVGSSAQSTVRNLDLMLVLDCSSSLAISGSFGPLQTAAINFINHFQEGAGGDRVGLAAFGNGAEVRYRLNQDFSYATRGFSKANITAAINGLPVPRSSPPYTYTASSEGMRRGLYELDLVPANIRSTLRVIVFFSDGEPNTFAGRFNNGGTPNPSNIQDGTLMSLNMNYLANALLISQSTYTNVNNISKLDTYTIPTPYVSDTTPIYFDYAAITGIAIPPAPPSPNADPLTQTVNLMSAPGTYQRGNYDKSGGNLQYTDCNVNKIARNMVENIANTARSGTGTNSVLIYTIGLGTLNSTEINGCGYGSQEWGQNVLRRLANDKSANTYNSSQPTGLYVNAPTAADLDRAFTTIANQILRLTK